MKYRIVETRWKWDHASRYWPEYRSWGMWRMIQRDDNWMCDTREEAEEAIVKHQAKREWRLRLVFGDDLIAIHNIAP